MVFWDKKRALSCKEITISKQENAGAFSTEPNHNLAVGVAYEL